MPSQVSAGHETTLLYYWEDNGFAASPNDTDAKPFGVDPTVNTSEGVNALQRIFQPNKREAIDQIALTFDGSFAIEFTLSNPWWMRALIGQPAQTNSDPVYEYDYTMSNDGEPDTIQIVEGHEQSGKERVLKGCMVTQVSIDVTVEQQVSVTVQGAYADEEIRTPQSLTTQPTTKYDPMTFSDSALKIDGTIEGYVQSMSATIQNNIDPVREMDTRVAVGYNPKTIEPSVNFRKIFAGSHDSLESLLGGSGATSVEEDANDNAVAIDLRFTNGETSGDGVNRGTLTISGTLSESYDESGIAEQTADLEENINRSGLAPSLHWENEEASAP